MAELPQTMLNPEQAMDANAQKFEENFKALEKIKENQNVPVSEEERLKLEEEKKKILEQIKDLEEDYYHPKEKMPDEEVEKITQDLLRHPLFMKELPENIEDNEHLVALQNIIYDDEPENIAKYNNEKGNEFFKKGSDKKYFLGEAKKCYTEGIEAEGKDLEINAKLYNNRALINIKQKNFGKAIDDSKASIKCNPKFLKPYFRCAQAMVFLHKYKQAIDMLKQGQKLDPKNKDIMKLMKEAEEKQKKTQEVKSQKDDVKKQEQNVLHNALKLRNIYLGKPIMDFPDGVKKCCWIDEEGKLHFPTFIQYPEFQQMDYIQDIQEDHVFQDHVAHLIGDRLPYDNQGIYNANNVEMYIELNQTEPYYEIKNVKEWPRVKGLVKIDSMKKFKQIMATKGYILPKVAEVFMVCPESKVFYEHFRNNFDFIKPEELKNFKK